jgi:sigma-E factor negative regulatory protein RseC
MEQVGVVIETMGDKARVKTRRHTICSNCGQCGGLHALEPARELTVVAQNPIGAREGDRVQLETSAGGVLLAAFLAYVVPLINFFLGFGLGQWLGRTWQLGNTEAPGIFLGLILLVASYLILRTQEHRLARNKNFVTVITKVLE